MIQSLDKVKKPIERALLAVRDSGDVESARLAVRDAYRDEERSHRLLLREVRTSTGDTSPGIARLVVGQITECDSSYEGARVFAYGEREDTQDAADSDAQEDGSGSLAWSGEVVGVDQGQGLLYVALDDPAARPSPGAFFLKPFNYLGNLHALYTDARSTNGSLPECGRMLAYRLSLSYGEQAEKYSDLRSSDDEAWNRAWRSAWGIVWGPPGTGKTTMIGRNLAKLLADPHERVLVVSTTNRATDEVALAIGTALCTEGAPALADGRVVRVGKGASFRLFEERGLLDMLRGTEAGMMREADNLRRRVDACSDLAERAELQAELSRLLRETKTIALERVADPPVSIVVATVYKATEFVVDGAITALRQSGFTPFTTVVVDEAGCVPRATVAALSLLASRRIILAGDPKQLSPVSSEARITPPDAAKWLSRSALNHLDARRVQDGCGFLDVQYRMHPEISRVVSEYQYAGRLRDSEEVIARTKAWDFGPPPPSRALWYVLDEEVGKAARCHAERPTSGRSWQRLAYREVLGKLLKLPNLRGADGIFLSPFAAQIREARQWLAQQGLTTWHASTVHSAQGTERDVVVFDTVHAGSTGWSEEEWVRLINVALSRARQTCILVASRCEMDQRYLRVLRNYLTPAVLRGRGGSLGWELVERRENIETEGGLCDVDTSRIGGQIESRAGLRALTSRDQERLIHLKMDGKPRLVRGVAGSGKTLVLARWCVQVLTDEAVTQDLPALFVYGNSALRALISSQLADAWELLHPHCPFPEEKLRTLHIRDLLDELARERSARRGKDRFDFDTDADLIAKASADGSYPPRYLALFLDEAQDMGHNTLSLLFSLVGRHGTDEKKGRAIYIMYDNAQDVYGRTTPNWKELGEDMRGRSTILKESFRSTRPIIEFATNVLYGLAREDLERDADWKELLDLGLVKQGTRGNREWWTVLYNRVAGPRPTLHEYSLASNQYQEMVGRVRELVERQGVSPGQIRILSFDSPWKEKNPVVEQIRRDLCEPLKRAGVPCLMTTNDMVQDAVTITTPYGLKGYDAEVVLVVNADRFQRGADTYAKLLYVAMTRARSILDVFCISPQGGAIRNRVVETLRAAHEIAEEELGDQEVSCPQDTVEDILDVIGEEHAGWLTRVAESIPLKYGSLETERGERLATPLFWFKWQGVRYACFGSEKLPTATAHRLEDEGVKLIFAGYDGPELDGVLHYDR